MRGDDADALGGVHRAAAADGDQAVAALLAVLGGTLVNERDPGIGTHLVEDDRLHVGASQRLERHVEEPCGLDAWVGDEQWPAHAEKARLGAELLDRAQALDEPRRALIGAEGVLEHGLT